MSDSKLITGNRTWGFCWGFFGNAAFCDLMDEMPGNGNFSFPDVNKEKAGSCSAVSEEAPLITGSN